MIKKALKVHNIYDFYVMTILQNSPYLDKEYVNGLCEIIKEEIQDELYTKDLMGVFYVRASRVYSTIRNMHYPNGDKVLDYYTSIQLKDLFFQTLDKKVLWEFLDEISTGKWDDFLYNNRSAFSKPWRDTWRAFKKVLQSNNWDSFVQAFDHFIDQVHNSGSILEKFSDDIQDAVEIKKHFRIKDFIKFASKDVQKLYYEHIKYNKGKEELNITPKQAYFFALNKIHGRWPEGEKIILQGYDSYIICFYALNIIKNRWLEGEKRLLELGEDYYIIYYAGKVIGGRWPEGEKVLLENKTPENIWDYAIEIMGKRWLEVEKIIEPTIKYMEYFNLN